MGIENLPKKELSEKSKETILNCALNTYNKTKDEFGHEKALKLAKPIFTTIGISEEEFIKKAQEKEQP